MSDLSSRNTRIYVWSGIASVALLFVVISGWLAVSMTVARRQEILPAIAKQLDYKAFVPASSAGAVVDKTTYKYDAKTKIFSYVALIGGEVRATVTEQALPSEFVDIPEAFEKMASAMGAFLTFDSSFGRVSICRSEKAPGAEMAVASGGGTLIFVKANGSLAESGWRKLFNGLAAN
jgi:hypothetical protein